MEQPMTTAREPRRAVLVGLAFLVALGGGVPGDTVGAMLPEGQNRKRAKQRIPVVWQQSVTGNRGIPIVARGTRGPITASIVRSGSAGRDAGSSVPTVIEVVSWGASPVQLSGSVATTIRAPEAAAGAMIQTDTPVTRSGPTAAAARATYRPAPLRGVQVYLGNESEPSAPATGDDPGNYRLGPGDLIDVFVWRNPELSRKVPVRPDGRISLPLVGEMVASGQTTRQIQDDITATLAQYIQVPTVTVTVTEIHSLVVYVLGNVAKPGPLQLNRNVTVLQAISMAGGLNEFADKNDITILRTVNGQQQRIPFRYGDFVKGKEHGPEILLRAGDVVYVP